MDDLDDRHGGGEPALLLLCMASKLGGGWWPLATHCPVMAGSSYERKSVQNILINIVYFL